MATGPSLAKDLRLAYGIAVGRPFNCLIQLTNRCNMRCSFCDFWPNGAPPADELTVDDYRRLSAEMAELGCFLISIEGGEPFVRPDLIDVVRAFSEHHLPTLFTNGWYATAENAQALFEAGLVQVGVSIDYPDARHDAKRGLEGATERAWQAVDLFKEAAPHGGKQVHVMTVLMESNWRDMQALLEQSAARGVGHVTTLLSTGGYRRAPTGPDRLPPPEAARELMRLWRRYPHFRYFHDYLRLMERYLDGQSMPPCRAGVQSFNVDHLGNVAPCIEHIDRPVGNVRSEPLRDIHARLRQREGLEGCQDCFTACRGLAQVMGGGGKLVGWRDLSTRMRSH